MTQADLSACRDALEALPWYANGTLGDAERERVDRHLAECTACSRELDTLMRMRAALAGRGNTTGDAAAFSGLLQRINHRERQARYWKIAAVLVAMLSIVLALTLPRYGIDADYRAVTEPVQAADHVRLAVTLHDPADIDALVQLLERYSADVIDAGGQGPFVLEFRLADSKSVTALERALRDEADVKSVARLDE